AAAGTGGPEAAAAPPGEETSAAPPGEEAALEGRPSAAAWAPLVWDKDLPPLELHLDPATSRPFALALRVTGVAGGPSEPDPFALAESASWDAGGADLLILDRRAAPFGALDREACRYLPGPRILCRLAFGGQDPLPGQAFSVGPEGAGAAATFSPLDAPPFASMDTPSREGGMTLAYGNAAGGAGTGIAAVSLLTGRILQEGVTGGILQEPADEGLPSEEATEGAFREEAAEGGSVAPPLPVIGGTFLEGGRKALTWSSAGSVTLWDLTGQEAEASLSVLFTRRGYEVALGPWAGEEGRRAPTEPAVP
ncbi:MAG: hypothetical protein LBW85_09440, partial [Deltaproteobacteria bacterium]|nr:hypothetical protein [Deltaproteobacteria bacterium]